MIARLDDAKIQAQLDALLPLVKKNQEECHLSLACNQALTNLISS